MSWSEATEIRPSGSAASTFVPETPVTPFSPEQIERAWGALLTADLTPGTTIKRSVPAPGTGASGLRISTREVTERPSSGGGAAEFELLAVLGTGGMGVVYEAVQASLGRSVALKRIRAEIPDGTEIRKAFLTEACVTGELDHPNIVPIYDLGEDHRGQLFYTMKKVGGTAWNAVLRDRTEEENLETLQRVADAVAFAHNRNVIHRDLKPENIMLGEFGEVLVMDWGLAAKVNPGGQGLDVSEEYVLCGTPGYMAPEMARGQAERIGTCSDIYLLGAILYEIITGKPPHFGKDAKACLHAAAENVIQSTERADELISIARTALATITDDRYLSVKVFQDALRTYRQHVESNRLATRAGACLAQAATSRDYRDFSQALFGFEEALTRWESNPSARDGLLKTRLAYASCAREKGDLDLALSLLRDDDPAQSALAAEIRDAQRQRDARARRHRWLTAAVVLLLFVTAVVSYGSFTSWRRQQERIRQEQEATSQTQYINTIALAQRRIDEGAFREACDLLGQTRPKDRHWEWGRLMRVCRIHLLQITSPAGVVRDVAFSPSGSLFFTAGKESWQLWDAASGELQFSGTLPNRRCFRFSQDGRYIHMGGQRFDTFTNEVETIAKTEGSVRAVSPQGAVLVVLPDEESAICRHGGNLLRLDASLAKTDYAYSACFSEDGSRLLIALPGGSAVLCDATSGKQTALFKGSGRGDTVVAIDASGGRAMTGSADGTVRIWKIADPSAQPLVLTGHRGAVHAVAFHPQNKGVATAGEDGSARYWFQKDGKIHWYAFRGHDDGVRSVAFSPDGTRLLTGGGDGSAKVWDLDINERARPLLPEELGASILAVAPNGRFVVGQRPIRGIPTIIRPGTGERVQAFLEKEGGADAAALSPDGRHLLVGIKEDLILYDRQTGKEVFRNRRIRSRGGFGPLRYSPDGHTFIDQRFGSRVALCDANSGARLRTFGPAENFMGPVAYDPSGRLLLAGPTIYDVESGEPRVHLQPEPKHHAQAAFSGDGRILATVGAEVAIWNSTTGERQRTLVLAEEKTFGRATCLALSADGSRLAVGRAQGWLTVWDLKTGEELFGRSCVPDVIAHLAFNREGMVLTLATDEGGWWCIDLTAGTCATIQDRPEIAGEIADWSPELDQAVILQSAPELRLWDLSGRPLRDLSGFSRPAITAAVSPDSTRILTAGHGYRNALWDADSGRLVDLLRTPHAPHSVRFSPQGDRALLVIGNHENTFWDLRSPAHAVSSGGMRDAQDAAFSPDGALLLTGCQDGNEDWNAYLWDVNSGQQRLVLTGHTGMVRAVAWSPDGTLLATGSEDRTLRLWDARSGEEVRLLRGHEATVRSIVFSPDGRRLITGGYDSTVRLWETRTGRELIVLQSPIRLNEQVQLQGSTVLARGGSKEAFVWTAADWSKSPEELDEMNEKRRLDQARYVVIGPARRCFIGQATVTLEPHQAGQVMHYTTDGSVPSPTSDRYTAPFPLDRTTLVRAAAFEGDTAGHISTVTFVRKELLPAQQVTGATPGLHFTVYREAIYGAYEAVEFEHAEELESGVCAGLGERRFGPGDSVGVRYTGWLRVPSDGLYRFLVETQRGNACRTTLDGQRVLDAPWVFTAQSDARWIALQAGLHRFEMTTYRYPHRPEVEVLWEGPGFQRTPLANAPFARGAN